MKHEIEAIKVTKYGKMIIYQLISLLCFYKIFKMYRHRYFYKLGPQHQC